MVVTEIIWPRKPGIFINTIWHFTEKNNCQSLAWRIKENFMNDLYFKSDLEVELVLVECCVCGGGRGDW